MLHTQARDLRYLAESISLAIPVKQLVTKRGDHHPGICGISASRGVKGIGHKEVFDLRNSLIYV